MQMRQRAGQTERELRSVGGSEPLVLPKLGAKSAGRIGMRSAAGRFRTRHFTFRIGLVRQLHHVVKAPRRIIAPDVQDLHQPLVRAGNGFVLEDAVELTLVGVLVLETRAENNFHRA